MFYFCLNYFLTTVLLAECFATIIPYKVLNNLIKYVLFVFELTFKSMYDRPFVDVPRTSHHVVPITSYN